MTLLPSPWRFGKINFLHFPSLPEVSVSSLQQVSRFPWGTTSCGALASCISLILKLRKKTSDARSIYRQKAVPSFHLHLFVLIIKGTCVTITKRDPSTCSLYASSWGSSKADIPLLNLAKLWLRHCPGQVAHPASGETWVSTSYSFLCEPCIKGPGRVCFVQTLARKGIWNNNLWLIKTSGGFDHTHFPQRKKHLSYACLKTEKKGGLFIIKTGNW